ncbi:hypothetical protein [Streptomyces monashensis]|uniref:FXSXX-COOH protein n=1 Tax=Streptomyces monashensis TaxID=1678012 RepID=A0A1S2PE24_9ACTN|nr:hypothetical protein BIV23_39430 [Streptomyces monashensis]
METVRRPAEPTAANRLRAVPADRTAVEDMGDFDMESAAARGTASGHLDQLAVDHPLGAG